jgi:hypothetical protein
LERIQSGVQEATKSAASLVGAASTSKSAGDYVDSATSLAASIVGYKTEPDSYIEILGDNVQKVMDAAATKASAVSKGVEGGYEAATQKAGEGFTAATTSAGNVYKAVSSSMVSILPTEIPEVAYSGGDAAISIVGVAKEQFASISVSASKVAASASASGSSVLGQVASSVADTGSRGVDQGSQSAQGLYDSIKDGVDGAGEAIEKASKAAKDAVVGVFVDDEQESKLVGKAPEDKDFNTVGKAAEAIKDRIVHADL